MTAKKTRLVGPITVEGFVVLHPIPSWDQKYASEIWGSAYGSFGRTAGEAWARQFPHPLNPGEEAARRQRAMDAGFRLARATMTIVPDGEPE